MSGFNWVSSQGSWVPPNAVTGGFDVNGENLYVGRAYHDGDLIPGKIVPSHECCYIAFAGDEKAHRQYEVLVAEYGPPPEWKQMYGGSVPADSVRGGQTSGGEPLFVGRTYHEGSLVIGKVHPSHGCLYASFGGRELNFSTYEILCIRPGGSYGGGGFPSQINVPYGGGVPAQPSYPNQGYPNNTGQPYQQPYQQDQTECCVVL